MEFYHCVLTPQVLGGKMGSKYDALDDLRLWTLNPNADEDGQEFIEFG